MHPCIVIRHGPAAEAESGPDDDRPLSEEGRVAIYEIGRGLAVTAPRPDLVLTSPWARAHETAEIVAAAFGGCALETVEDLSPGAAPADILAALAQRCDTASGGFAVVGHEPDLGRFISYALAATARGFHSPHKGGASLLEFPATPRAGNATIDWMLEPQHLRAVGREGSAPSADAS